MPDRLPSLIADATSVSSAFECDLPPVLTVGEGDTFAVQTRSILTHVDVADRDNFEILTDYSHMDIPVTGPIEVLGARRGDVLRVDVHEIYIAEMGAMVTLEGRGGFSTTLKPAGKLIPIAGDKVMFDDTALPLEPMIGKIGVGAPGDPHCSTVGPHGGNMDCTSIGPGSTLYVPIFVDGAQLYMGDLHARQCDGEASLTGVEVEGTVIASCEVLRGWQLKRPILVTTNDTITIGDGDDLDEAARLALDDMLGLVRAQSTWTAEESAMFLSIAADVGICQVVNPRKSVRVTLPKNRFPVQLPPVHSKETNNA
ncbi:acetamidase/formamidase family protein [Pseudarthrobacter sp. SSS035]|uniref:acetamidase/formamidase family protein n=1 Tax=Pseudarthrobacter sp. SSS035 TaxID=2931399 RepID=UPI002010AA40|nr:acetamidase/formamidase family protein [Pseudarthrobacter sp. SSS035]